MKSKYLLWQLAAAICLFAAACAKDERKWQEIRIPGVGLRDMIWVNNQFVAAGQKATVDIGNQDHAFSLISSDGINWASHDTGQFYGNRCDIYWLNNQYIMTAENIDRKRIFLTSPDAVYWNSVIPAGIENAFARLAWDGSRYIIGGDWFGYIYTSTDLYNWIRINLQKENWLLYDIFYLDGKFLAIGTICLSNCQSSEHRVLRPAVFHSLDASNWIEIESLSGFSFVSVNDLKSIYLINGAFGSIFTSSNGTNWTNRSIAFGPELRSVAFGKGEYVFPVNKYSQPGGMEIWSTSDFVSWQQYIYKKPYTLLDEVFNSSDYREFTSVAFDGSKFVVAGYESKYFKNELTGYTGIVLVSP